MKLKDELLRSTQYEKKWLLLVFFYLAIDLARVQQVVPGLAALRPGLISIILLSLYLLGSKQLYLVFSSPQIKLIFLFVILLFVYIPFADGAHAAFNAAIGMMLFLPFIFSCVLLITSKRKLVHLCKFYVLILLFVCCYALTHKGRGPGGSIADENDLCLFVVCILPLSFFLIKQESKATLKLLWVAVVLISLVTIVTTFSRGGFVGMVVMGATYWWFSKRKVIILICIISIGSAIIYYGGNRYDKEMETITNTHESTANERLLSWQAAYNMFLDNPLGVGGDNFPRHFPDYQPKEFKRDMWGRAAHSLWFTLIPETGVVGIVLYFSIIYLNFKDIFFILWHKSLVQNNDKEFFDAISCALFSSLLGFYAAGTFISVLYYPIFWYLTALVVCMRNIHTNMIADMAN